MLRLTTLCPPSQLLAVYSRFQSVLTIQAMGSAHLGILGSEAKALAVLWLQELVDDEERVIRIPVLKSKNLKQLRQNVSPRLASVLSEAATEPARSFAPQYINEFTQKTHDYEIVRLVSVPSFFSAPKLISAPSLFLQVGWLTTK